MARMFNEHSLHDGDQIYTDIDDKAAEEYKKGSKQAQFLTNSFYADYMRCEARGDE